MHQHRARLTAAGRRVALAAALAGLLTACGGGGGGGDSPAAPADTPARDKPLALSAANRDGAATLAVGYAGTALSMGQAAVDWVSALDAARTATASGSCRNGGSYTLTLTDRDNNGRPSAGDRLDVVVTGCWIDPLEDAFSGALAIDLVAPPSGATWAGTMTPGAGFSLADTSQGTIRLSGPLTFDYTVTDARRTLHVGSGASPFVILATAAGQSLTESISAVDVRRELDREAARNRLTLSLTASSDTLGGRVVLATGTSLASWLNAYPDAGALSVSGASGQSVTVTADGVRNVFVFDLAGNGNVADVTRVLPAFVFSTKGLAGADADSNGSYKLKPASASFALAISPANASIDPSGTFTWQYTKPIAADAISGTLALHATAVSGRDSWGRETVGLTWQVKGAWVTATPVEQLAPGQSYGTLTPAASVSSMSGNEFTDAPHWLGTTRATVSAKVGLSSTGLLVGPTASVTLDASASTATGGAAAYAWRQISGPPLIFSRTDQAVIQVRPQAADTGAAVVELEVRNPAGERDISRVTLQVAGGVNGLFLASRFADTDWLTVLTQPDSPPPNYVRYNAGIGFLDMTVTGNPTSGRLVVAAPPASWVVGGTIAFPASGVTYSFTAPSLGGGGCSGDGAIRIRDFALAADGAVASLALDFDQACNGRRLFGQVRYNSSVPPTP